MSLPNVSIGQVVSQDPFNGGLRVMLRTQGQGFPYSVQMPYFGQADGLRIRQNPLPMPGTWGIILFPYGDARNGVWLCSLLPSLVDALTGTVSGIGPTSPTTDSYIDYYSHWSGYWNLLDSQGQLAVQFPDGSFFVVGSGATLPNVYRHTLDGNQNRNSVPFSLKDRVATSPVSGYSFVALVSGAVFLQTPAFQVSGSILSTGNMSAGNGATGSFVSADNQVINVVNGIVVAIN